MKGLTTIIAVISCAICINTCFAFPTVHGYQEAFDSANPKDFPPVEQLTTEPNGHWFGYYDKLQFSPDSRYLLSMEVDFEKRSPKPNDIIKIGMIDLKNNNKWHYLGETRAWGWQQGCMLQWLPKSDSKVMWNDRQGDHFICKILDIKTGVMTILPNAVYTVSPDGKWGLTLNFERVEHLRRGYGYCGVTDPSKDQTTPTDRGLYKINMQTGEKQLLIAIADIVKIPYDRPHPKDMHYFNHLQWNTDGSRFVFFHRWVPGVKRERSFMTRAFTADSNGKNIRIFSEKPGLSHFEWKDKESILFYRENIRSYVLIKDDGSQNEEVVLEAPNGHNSYLRAYPDWIITDTYPRGKENQQYLYLYNVKTHRTIILNHFFQPREYKHKEWRVDLHSRISPDCSKIVIDSLHNHSRQMYMIDISGIIESNLGVICEPSKK